MYIIYTTRINIVCSSTIMKLDDSGDVTWTVPAGLEELPLFSCETYDVFNTSLAGVIIRFGAYQGHIIEFRVSVLF